MVSRFILRHYVKTLSFVIIGAIGFVIDATILTLLLHSSDLTLLSSRIFSFSGATFVTWLLNRTYTFKLNTKKTIYKGLEYLKYISVQLFGALLNLLVFITIIWLQPDLISIPVIPLAIGAFFGLLFNYLATYYWVYK